MIATYPVPGVAWDYVQYVSGLLDLGYEVVYLEDTGLDSYHASPATYLQESLNRLIQPRRIRWHYRKPDGTTDGISVEALRRDFADADVFINVSGGALLRDEYMQCANKILIDTDPGLNQFVNYPKWDASPGYEGTHGYRGHDHFFTYATRIGRTGCTIPTLGIDWKTTLPPVTLRDWAPSGAASTWTTVMSWKPFQHYSENVLPSGISFGAKEVEFPKIERLPTVCKSSLEVAVGGQGAPLEYWRSLGWRTAEADVVAGELDMYNRYISSSRGECSVAKHMYVATHSGWFSTRSVCYLAASRPIVVQETGFSETIPTGHGILAFSTLEEAQTAIDAVESDYRLHQTAARDAADTVFRSDVVIRKLLESL